MTFDSWDAKERASKLRRDFRCTEVAWFPVQQVAVWHGLDMTPDDDHERRLEDALLLGSHLGVADVMSFATELLAPPWMLEPLVSVGRDTGERWLFGLLKKRSPWRLSELASLFGCPLDVLSEQLRMVP